MNHPERLKGWYNLAGGGAGFLLVESNDPRELTAFLQPYMDLMSFDVRSVYELKYEERLKELREIGIEVMILSSEPNRVVEARARKMGVEAVHGVALHEKGRVMREILEMKNLQAENVIYIGNDINDLPCFEVAGWSVAVADAFPAVIQAADYVLSKNGGHGALREMCDLILNKNKS